MLFIFHSFFTTVIKNRVSFSAFFEDFFGVLWLSKLCEEWFEGSNNMTNEPAHAFLLPTNQQHPLTDQNTSVQ